MRKKFLLGIFLSIFLAACASEPEPIEPPMFEKYDQYSDQLHEQVKTGEITVAEAEKLRREAFRNYLAELKEYRIDREARNW